MVHLDDEIEFPDSDGNLESFDIGALIFHCIDMNIMELDANFPNNPKSICNECVEMLRTIYKFKSSCKRNNDSYFMTETVFEEETFADDFKDEESMDGSTIVIEMDEGSAYEDHSSMFDMNSSSEMPDDRRKANNLKNAIRQRLKRMNETPEEKEIRRKKVAEQTRRRREIMRKKRPEMYEKILNQVAERKRVKRKQMTEEEKAVLRAKEAEAARIRRNQLSQEQKEELKRRNREQARARRSKVSQIVYEDATNENGENGIWTVIEGDFNEC